MMMLRIKIKRKGNSSFWKNLWDAFLDPSADARAFDALAKEYRKLYVSEAENNG